MADAGRSLKVFYIALSVIAVAGIALILHAATSRAGAPLVMADCSGPPLGAVQPTGHVLGPDSAPVQIDEYSDFECPFCARFAIVTMPDVRQRLIPTGKVRWRFMDYPLQQHENSPLAHVAASCAAEQGKFWEMEYALYDHQNAWVDERRPEGKFLDYARQIGLDADSFQVCEREQRPWPQIEASRCLGDKLGVEGTPTFFVNGHKLEDPTLAYDDLTRMVDSASAAAAARPAAKPR